MTTPLPRRAAVRPGGRPPSSVPASFATDNPVDDDGPPTIPIQPAPPPAPANPAAAHPTATTRRAPASRTAPPSSPAAPRTHPAPPVGLGAQRAEQTGKPRVDWAEYDAQAYVGPPEWLLYRCWTRVVIDGRWWVRLWQHFLAFILGRRHQLLWIGISMRSMIARGTEHLADKSWRRLIHVIEIDPDVTFATEAEAELYEEARIAAECPRFNRKGNDRAYNPGATHLTKRFHTRHRADWQQQAGEIALGWLIAAAVFTWLLYPAAEPGAAGFMAGLDRLFSGIVSGVTTAAAALMSWRIIRLAFRGAQPTTAQRARLARRR